MLKLSDTAIEPVTQRLGSHGLRPVYLVPTPTGLRKSIMDATKSVQAFLYDVGLHDYSQQPQGPEHKVRIEATFIHADRIKNTRASFYRSLTRGDPRIWFTDLPRYATDRNLLVLVHVAGTLAIINASNPGILDSIDEATSPLANLARQASVGRSLRAGYTDDSGTAPTVLAIGATEKGRETTDTTQKSSGLGPRDEAQPNPRPDDPPAYVDDQETLFSESQPDIPEKRTTVPNRVTPEKRSIEWFLSRIRKVNEPDGLNLDPPYQRRYVWKTRNKHLLIDSIIRKYPIGAVTLHKSPDDEGGKYSVIDGKQRLNAIYTYCEDEWCLSRKQVEAAEKGSGDLNVHRSDAVEMAYGSSFQSLTPKLQRVITNTEIPTIEIEGSREFLVMGFKRINETVFPLAPQEIRNAVYDKTPFLETVKAGIEEIDLEHQKRMKKYKHDWNKAYLLANHAVTKTKYPRMADDEFFSELLAMALEKNVEPHERRDELEEVYEQYAHKASKSGALAKKLKTANKKVVDAVNNIGETWKATSVQGSGFQYAEHDYYALAGAFMRAGVKKKDVDASGGELKERLGGYRKNVQKCKKAQRAYSRALKEGKNPSLVKPEDYYAGAYQYALELSPPGNVHTKDRREHRIAMLVQVIEMVIEPRSSKRFTEQDRQDFWNDNDPICVRCNEEVLWEHYHLGHRKALANRGPSTLENAGIEHWWCNLRAGDREDVVEEVG